MNRWRLDGARAVVTGGTRGIGLAVVLELLELGASVVTAGRDLEDLDPRLTPARDAGRLTLIATDLATVDGRAALVDAIPDGWDALEILVNNVGTNVRQPSLAVTSDDYQRILDTNVTCAWDLSRALHPRLAASGRGAIVNVGSVAGQVSVGTGAVYAMSKAAIEHLTRYLAVEWARDGIRVNAVAPWYIRTPLVEPILGDPATLGARARGDADGTRRRAARSRRGDRVPLPAGGVVRDRPGDRGRRRLPRLRLQPAAAGVAARSGLRAIAVIHRLPPRVRTSTKPACVANHDSSSGVDVLLTLTGRASGSMRIVCVKMRPALRRQQVDVVDVDAAART